jgi:hypothetical protein
MAEVFRQILVQRRFQHILRERTVSTTGRAGQSQPSAVGLSHHRRCSSLLGDSCCPCPHSSSVYSRCPMSSPTVPILPASARRVGPKHRPRHSPSSVRSDSSGPSPPSCPAPTGPPPEHRRAVVNEHALMVLRLLPPGVHELSSLLIAHLGLVRIGGRTVLDGKESGHVRGLVDPDSRVRRVLSEPTFVSMPAQSESSRCRPRGSASTDSGSGPVLRATCQSRPEPRSGHVLTTTTTQT